MSETQSSRKKFLQLLGLTAGAALVGKSALAAIANHEEILKLNPEQQTFMIGYGKWMDEFIEVIRIQKTEPDNMANHKRMIALTEQAEAMQPQLTEFMKDKTFALIYKTSIERMRKEI